ncbi:MAG: [protein-PII] uridylyltransferase [Candidatus Nanopelagicales bacterium]|jgi:[protein-PII] uridylyltransferase|nr:[protein-PII] uridylyltransferase [Candidatus Nanopelagicales bacterium]
MTAPTSELPPATAFLAARAALLEAPGRPSAQARRALTALTDDWLVTLFTQSGAAQRGATLVAVGGHGRAELSPGSDLDLLLLHPGGPIADVADALWYPVWDSGLRLDHAVRTVAEARRMAANDVRVVLGLLDARTLAGDDTMTQALKASVLADWRALAANRLPDLHASVRERAAANGDLAHLLEPDLKEAHGGLRELTVLRAVSASWLCDAPHAELGPAKALLLDTRDALHRTAARPTDRLTHQEQAGVAAVLGLPDQDALLRAVSGAGRSIGVASDATWHAVLRTLRARPKPGLKKLGRRPVRRSPLAEGVVLQDGEAVLAAEARPDRDPVLVLRAAAAAAQSGVLLGRHAVSRLAAESAPMPVPWPAPARDALVSLLGAGRAAVPVWEALDQAGIIATLIPHWDVVRSAPQHNPVHRFTVDRHLLEAAVQACAFARDVHRPDLLLVGCLLHDIGKGRPGVDHTDAGVGLVAEIAPHLGFDTEDTETLVALCRHHLLLPETATRRDLDDPHVIDTVATAVGSAEVLELLAALTVADALATGPLAWTSWKRQLVTELVQRTRGVLAGEQVPVAPRISEDQWAMAAGDGVRVLLQEHDGGYDVTVGAPDRVGLLGLVAGVLSMHRLEVRAALTQTVGDRAVEVWSVNPLFGEPPAADRLREDIRRALAGQLDVAARLAARDAAVRRPDAPETLPARVEVIEGASSRATVLEVRAHDAPGLLHRVGTAIASTGTDITAARVSTLGSEVVDVFFLVDRRGQPLAPDLAEAVAEAVAESLAAGEDPALAG